MNYNELIDFFKYPNITLVDTRLWIMFIFNILMILLLIYLRRDSRLGIKSVLPDFSLFVLAGFFAMFIKYLERENQINALINKIENLYLTNNHILLLENQVIINQILMFIISSGLISFGLWVFIVKKIIKDDELNHLKILIDDPNIITKTSKISPSWKRIVQGKNPKSIDYKALMMQYNTILLENKIQKYSNDNKWRLGFLNALENSPYIISLSILLFESYLIFDLTFTNKF